MAFRKSSEARPQIIDVRPPAAIPGGEFQIRGRGLAAGTRPFVSIGQLAAPIIVGSDSYVVARVPEGASEGELVVGQNHSSSSAWPCHVGVPIADGLHPVANPVIDHHGDVYSTFSGSPGQKAPVSVYKIDTNNRSRPYVTDVMNATSLALDHDEVLYVSSRHEGVVYQVSPGGNLTVYVEGMGVATGLVFDQEDNLYVGDRSGTIFKVGRQRQIYVFATLDPSIAAYHLAFGPDGYLYVSGPTTSSFDAIHRISPEGQVEVFYRGLGRPQGMAFDVKGNLYIAASLRGRRGIVRLTTDAVADLYLSGPSIVGLAFAPSKAMILATNSSLFRVDSGIEGRRLH